MRLEVPSPEQVRAAREAAQLTQAQAAALVHLGHYARWSEFERGEQPIDLARWELFLLKTLHFAEYRELVQIAPRHGRPPSWASGIEAKRQYVKKTARRK